MITHLARGDTMHLLLLYLQDCPIGTVTSTTNCDSANNECRDSTTLEFYDKAACRYPAGAKCSNILGTSSTVIPVTCTSPEVPDPGQAQTSITSLTPSAAVDLCCAQVSMVS
jgi:hypothetical protein